MWMIQRILDQENIMFLPAKYRSEKKDEELVLQQLARGLPRTVRASDNLILTTSPLTQLALFILHSPRLRAASKTHRSSQAVWVPWMEDQRHETATGALMSKNLRM